MKTHRISSSANFLNYPYGSALLFSSISHHVKRRRTYFVSHHVCLPVVLSSRSRKDIDELHRSIVRPKYNIRLNYYCTTLNRYRHQYNRPTKIPYLPMKT